MNECHSCARECGVDRSCRAGFCKMGNRPVIARAGLHFWEEPCISGTKGSGTVFFSGCNLRCVYCQNYEISSECQGKEVTVERLREIYRELIAKGAHNINLVTPAHDLPDIVWALFKAKEQGLCFPVVYNGSG